MDRAKGYYEHTNGVDIRFLSSFGMWNSTPLAPGMIGAMRRLDADIVHLHTPFPLGEVAYLFGGRDQKGIVSWHSDIVKQKLLLRGYRPLLIGVLSRAKRIIVATPRHITVSKCLWSYRNECVVCHYGVGVERFRITRSISSWVEQIRSEHGDRIVVFVGRVKCRLSDFRPGNAPTGQQQCMLRHWRGRQSLPPW